MRSAILSASWPTLTATPDVKEKIEAIGLIPHETPSIEGMSRYIKAETDKVGHARAQPGIGGLRITGTAGTGLFYLPVSCGVTTAPKRPDCKGKRLVPRCRSS